MNKSQPSQLQQQNPRIPPKPTNNNDTKYNNNNLTYLAKMNDNNNNKKNNRKIWDCGSTLYDSFELDSFRKQLDSAIISSSRTLSMPRLPSEHSRQPLSQPQLPAKKPSSSKFSRTFQKLLRTVFRGSKHDKNKTASPGDSGTASPDPWFFDSPLSYEDKSGEKVIDSGGKYYVVYEKTDINGLSSIPEVNEVNVSPEFGSSLVRKTMSERFTTARPLGIRCS